MNEVNKELKDYIRINIFPKYDKFYAHGMLHINNVINNMMMLADYYNLNRNIAYVIACYHDSGLSIDRDNHELASGGIPDITPPNIEVINKYNWFYHKPSMANCLLSWGFPEEEIIPIWNSADELANYAVRKGILTIQIEGQKAHLFVPEEINNALSATLNNDLNLISNQEEKTNTRMNFLKIVHPNGQMITRPDPEDPENILPFYTEEINDTLKSLGILKDEITEESDASLKAM